MENKVHEPALAYGKFDTIDDFIQFTETSEQRFEFWNGDSLVVSATTQAHAEIAGNTNALLKSKLKIRGCKSFQESVFLRIKHENILFLPDVLVTCNPEDIAPNSRFVDNPSIIVEVLSESTELYDRSQKWQQYRQIPSLRYYIMISQQTPFVEIYGRPHDQSLFYYQVCEGIDANIELTEMEITLSMEALYDGILFENPKQPS